MTSPAPSDTSTDVGERILEITSALATELHGVPAADLDLDSSFDRDFGLESLARAELLHRIEQEYRVVLPDATLASAERPRDLVDAVLRASGRRAALEPAAPIKAVRELEGFARARTLTEVLEMHLQRRPEQIQIRLLANGQEREITYAGLAVAARRIAAGILDAGLDAHATIAIMLPTCQDYYSTFFGVLLAGCIPVPIYPPARPGQIEDHLTRHAGILENARASLLISFAEAKRAAHLLRTRVPSIRKVVSASDLASGGEPAALPHVNAGDIAFLQYTSGSTGNPKGVVLTHANLLANLRSIGKQMRPAPEDVVVSWLPLYHDMGLIGTWLGSFYYALPLVAMAPQRFLARPGEWLRAIHRFRGTLSASPNFGYELCVNRIPEAELDAIDLSSWRLAMNGAEPVSSETMRRFIDRFARCGFRRQAMAPVYGLAEATLAVTFPPLNRGPLGESIDRAAFMTRGEAVETNSADALHVVGCGMPLPDTEVRIVGTGDAELPDRREGQIEFRGPSATSGYYRNAGETRQLLHNGWLRTGDLGYLAGRELFVTGRARDMIIRAGRHFYPQEIEECVSGVEGIRKGCVAVFGVRDVRAQTERLVVVAETRETDDARRRRITSAVRSKTVEICGAPPEEVLLVPPHTVLKTSSGKIRRSAVRDLYERRKLGATTRPAGLQLLHLYVTAARPEAVRLWHSLREAAFAGYALAVGAFTAALVWLIIVITPALRWRRRIQRPLSRCLLRVLGIGVRIEGATSLPRRPCVVVANHASYLDGLVLSATLEVPATYVVKSEFRHRFIPRLFFSRLGFLFVERFEAARSLEDTNLLDAAVRRGETVAVFPEGTFLRAPGLLPFRMGAFVVAARAGAAVVPVSIRGTRSILRGSDWFPRRGDVRVTIGDPIAPSGQGWPAAIELQQRARAMILKHCGEPDLEMR
jgi:1-acyl-sn-glycerol-3-phosphate acyltransferase